MTGPVKDRLLAALPFGVQVSAGDLCEAVYGSREAKRRDALRNHVAQLRKDLASGLTIDGRNELKRNAYLLRATVL